MTKKDKIEWLYSTQRDLMALNQEQKDIINTLNSCIYNLEEEIKDDEDYIEY